MNDMGILNAAILSTKGIRAWAPGANICAGGTLEIQIKCRAMGLTDTIFPRTFRECNVHNVIVHITHFVFVQSAKAAGRILFFYADDVSDQ
jgi:hypothetical protein